MSKYSSINTRAFVSMIRMLHEGDVTRDQIIEKLGIQPLTASRWLALLGSKTPKMRGRLVYISGWTRKGTRGNLAAQWTYGFEMLDVPKPKPMTQTEYSQRYRAKLRGYGQLPRSNA